MLPKNVDVQAEIVYSVGDKIIIENRQFTVIKRIKVNDSINLVHEWLASPLDLIDFLISKGVIC